MNSEEIRFLLDRVPIIELSSNQITDFINYFRTNCTKDISMPFLRSA